ncbi:MAG: T9SS type A sorting domain-containing protein [Bacteroidia bacterium]
MRILTIIAILVTINAKAQYISASLLSSGGDLFKANNIQMEWTLGDLATETYHNGSYVTQGFLQGSPTLVVGQKEVHFTNNSSNILAYPNPFTNGFELEILNTKPTDNLTITVYDLLGKMVYKNNNADALQYINLEHLAASVYIVNVLINNEKIGTIKVNKL